MTIKFRCEKGHLFDSDIPDDEKWDGLYMFGCKQFAYCAFCEFKHKGWHVDEKTGEEFDNYCILMREGKHA